MKSFYNISGYSWDANVHDILADLGTEFYFYDPLRSNLTSLRDLGSHSNEYPSMTVCGLHRTCQEVMKPVV